MLFKNLESNIFIDGSEPGVNTCIDFGPDYLPPLKELIENDTRKAITHYHYRDNQNNYFVDFRVSHNYSDGTFEFVPKNLSITPQKEYKLAVNLLVTSEKQLGLILQYDIWRFRLNSGGFINSNLEGVAVIGIGFKI